MAGWIEVKSQGRGVRMIRENGWKEEERRGIGKSHTRKRRERVGVEVPFRREGRGEGRGKAEGRGEEKG